MLHVSYIIIGKKFTCGSGISCDNQCGYRVQSALIVNSDDALQPMRSSTNQRSQIKGRNANYCSRYKVSVVYKAMACGGSAAGWMKHLARKMVKCSNFYKPQYQLWFIKITAFNHF